MLPALALCVAALACAAGVGAKSSGVAPVAAIRSDLTRDQQIEHALSRLSFGARPGDVDRVRSVGLERWIAQQLAPETVSDASTDSILTSYRSLTVASSDLMRGFREVRMARRDTASRMDVTDSRRMLQQALGEVSAAKLTRAVISERQLFEQMVDFWENHFSVFAGKGQTRLFIPSYDRDVIRPNAMGRFRDLLGAVAKSPAMLFFLDNAQSVADSTHATLAGRRGLAARGPRPGARRGLNENYARELMELHTLGVDGGYTQQDVIEVARALTGWSIDPAQGAFVFRPAAHDADAKTVLGVHLAPGRGIEDGEQVLDILAKQPATARHIVTKLALRFVSDSAPPQLVDRCSRVFLSTDGDIRSTLRCVVTAPEFFSRAAYRGKVKTPFELVASALRATGSVPDGTPRSAQIVARLGQPIFGRQTPDGWPDRATDWVNSGSMMNRVNFGLQLASGRMPGVRVGTFDGIAGAQLSSPDFQKR